MKYNLMDKAEVVILGDWINKGSYAEWDGSALLFKKID